MRHVTVLHTRDRAEADTETFVAPLKTARGVWFGGGRQWRLVDAYLGTRTQRELEAVLARDGVIGGSSSGATIQGSYLVRATDRTLTLQLSAGRYRFAVSAANYVGTGPRSARSDAVRAR